MSDGAHVIRHWSTLSGVARGGGGARGPWPPKLLVVNFPINLRCYVLLGCRVINVILTINIGDSAFFDIAALVRQFGGLRHHQQTESIHWPPPKPKSWLRHCRRLRSKRKRPIVAARWSSRELICRRQCN